MSLISSSSATRSWLFSALAAADSISLRMSCAALRVEKRSRGSASSIGSPRTWSATRRALRGATRTKRARALTTGRSGASFLARLGLVSLFGLASYFAGAFLAGSFFAAGFVVAAFFAGALEAEAVDSFFAAGLRAREPPPDPETGFFAAVLLRAGFSDSAAFFV